MKRLSTLLFVLLGLFGAQLYAQVQYQSGFIIDRDNQRIACEILDKGWRSTPSEIEYRLNTEASSKTATVTDLNGFGIDNCCRYIRYFGEVDASSDDLGELSRYPGPDWVTDSIFLEVLLEGKASLYLHRSGNTEKFFLQLDDEPIQPLLRKRFRNAQNLIGTNNHFRSQLKRLLICEGLNVNRLSSLNYEERPLTNYLRAYNSCQGVPSSGFSKERTPFRFELSLRPGLAFNSTSIFNVLDNRRDADYGSYNSYRIGLEAAFTLPFGKEKWAIIVEPSYQSISETTTTTFAPQQEAALEYQSVSIPLGVRYYSFLGDQASLFADVGFAVNLNLTNEVNYPLFQSTLALKDQGSPFAGVGGRYGNFGLEVRYIPFIDLTSEYTFWRTEFQRIELIVGYTLLK